MSRVFGASLANLVSRFSFLVCRVMKWHEMGKARNESRGTNSNVLCVLRASLCGLCGWLLKPLTTEYIKVSQRTQRKALLHIREMRKQKRGTNLTADGQWPTAHQRLGSAKRILRRTLPVLLAIATQAPANAEVLDRVVASVDGKPILLSRVDEQARIVAMLEGH